MDPHQVIIERQEFLDQMSEMEKFSNDEIQVVSEVLYELSSEISLHQLEDFALGFQQEAVKLFMYGKCDDKLFAFDKKLPVVNPKKTDKTQGRGGAFDLDSSSDSDDSEAAQVKMAVITRPTVITFPRFTPKVVQVTCGIGHILALTA